MYYLAAIIFIIAIILAAVIVIKITAGSQSVQLSETPTIFQTDSVWACHMSDVGLRLLRISRTYQDRTILVGVPSPEMVEYCEDRIRAANGVIPDNLVITVKRSRHATH